MTQVCYLCGQYIANQNISDDHVIPKQLILRKQPKAKGFDYGGTLPTHGKCNNEFGSEKYCVKAIKLLDVMTANTSFKHGADSSIEILPIRPDSLTGFTKGDFRFFKIFDVTNITPTELLIPEFYQDKPKTNLNMSMFIALAVLSKSAAALLVSRKSILIPNSWNIFAFPYTGNIDFDSMFGHVKPFDIGVKVWVLPFESGDRFVAYRAQNIIVFLFFKISSTDTVLNEILRIFENAERLEFQGENLNQLVDYQWKPV